MLTRAKVCELCEQLEMVLKEFAAANQLKATVGAATFTPNNVRFQVELAIIGEGGEPITREAENFQTWAGSFGLTPEHLGKTFRHAGKVMKIVGLKVRNKTYPVIAEDESGKKYKFPADLVKALTAVAEWPSAAEPARSGPAQGES